MQTHIDSILKYITVFSKINPLNLVVTRWSKNPEVVRIPNAALEISVIHLSVSHPTKYWFTPSK